MDLRQLRYFLAVAEERSFTKAAQRLNMSQPPLTQQIQALERHLDTRLFFRTSRRVELTDAGRALMERASGILEQVLAAQKEVRSIGAGQIGVLNIGATGSILRGGLADLLAEFARTSPGVVVRIQEQAPALQMAALIDRRTHVSFNRSLPTHSELAHELGWKEDVVAVLPLGHRFAQCLELSLPDLKDERHIILQPESSDFARYLQSCFVEAGFLPKISQQVVDAQSIPSLIAAGFGVAVVPESIAKFTSDEVLFVALHPKPPSADVHIVYRRDNTSALTAGFLNVARSFLATASLTTLPRTKRNS